MPLSSLPNSYSQKALFLAHVATDDAVYRPSSESVIQSAVFSPGPSDPNQTAVAFAQIEEGWLGYLGDVNNEQGSQDVIHAMLELGTKHKR